MQGSSTWPFDLVTWESDWTVGGEVEEWQGVIASTPLGKTGSFTKALRPDGIWGTVSCAHRTTGIRRCWKWGFPPSLHPCLGLLMRPSYLMVLAPPLRFFIAFLGIELVLTQNECGSTDL